LIQFDNRRITFDPINRKLSAIMIRSSNIKRNRRLLVDDEFFCIVGSKEDNITYKKKIDEHLAEEKGR